MIPLRGASMIEEKSSRIAVGAWVTRCFSPALMGCWLFAGLLGISAVKRNRQLRLIRLDFVLGREPPNRAGSRRQAELRTRVNRMLKPGGSPEMSTPPRGNDGLGDWRPLHNAALGASLLGAPRFLLIWIRYPDGKSSDLKNSAGQLWPDRAVHLENVGEDEAGHREVSRAIRSRAHPPASRPSRPSRSPHWRPGVRESRRTVQPCGRASSWPRPRYRIWQARILPNLREGP
jgi:hypothetical protein